MCNLVYPDFRSFKEMYQLKNKYKPFSVDSAVDSLNKAKNKKNKYCKELAYLSDWGRKLEAHIVSNDYDGAELNIWHEYEYVRQIIK